MSKQSRRTFLKHIGASTAVLISPKFLLGAQPPERKPNIIFILTDDLGYGDLGCYGQKKIKTPNLDKMAANGIRLTQHYAGSTVSAPSRCVLMTGLHTGHARIRGNATVPLEPDDGTVAELLKKGGYTTGLIGKWGLGEAGSTGIPNRQGFDHFFGYLNQIRAHNYYPTYLWRNEEKHELNNEVVYSPDGYAKGIGSAATKRIDYSHDLFAAEALGFVEQHKDGPFFLYLALTIPHANNEHHLVNKHGMEVPDYGIYEDRDWPDAQKGHAAMISRMDTDVGRLLDKLTQLGIAQNTLVMFSSDNGPHKEGGADPDFFDSNGSLRGIKRDLYEGGIRVPFIAYWPKHIKPGTTSDHICGFQDLLPTCAELAGVKPPKDIDGISFVPTLLGKGTQKRHEYLYWEFDEQGGKQALRMGRWKAVRFLRDGRLELYDLSKDVGEQNDIADKRPGMLAQIGRRLDKARTISEPFPLPVLDRHPGKPG